MIRPRAAIEAMAPYALPDITAPEGVQPVVLAQNEHAFPPSATVQEAIQIAISSGQLYPDSEWRDLRAAIAAAHGLEPGRILCGSGSMELMTLLINCYVEPTQRLLMTEYGYLFMRTLVKMVEARLDVAAEKDYRVDIDQLIASASDATRVVFVVNPGNPSGTVIHNDEIRRLRAALPDHVILLVDEAYAEFVDAGFHEPLFDLVDAGNTVVTRTFSKIYGLAGLRVGWGYFPDHMVTELRKVQIPGGLSTLSQVAATAAMHDQAGMRAARSEIARLRDLLSDGLRETGFTVVPSQTNFVLVEFESAQSAAEAFAWLRDRGLVVRPMGGYGLPQCLRISVGVEESMRATVDALREWRN